MLGGEILKPSQRDSALDIVRAFGIILMIMGHVGFGDNFSHFIHAFHMPLFFIVSGYLLSIPKGPQWYIKKAVKMVSSYFIFAIIGIIFQTLFDHGFNNIESYLRAVVMVDSSAIPISGAVWFLIVFLWGQMFYGLILQFSQKYEIILGVLCVFLGILMNNLHIYLFMIDVSFVSIGFLLIGRLIRKYQIISKIKQICFISPKGILMQLFGICITISIFFFPEVNMRIREYGIVFVFFFNATCAVCVIWWLALRITSKKTVLDNVIRLVEKVGRNSLMYLGLNQIVIIVVQYVFQKISGGGYEIFKQYNILIFSVSFVILYALAEILSKFNIYIKELI